MSWVLQSQPGARVLKWFSAVFAPKSHLGSFEKSTCQGHTLTASESPWEPASGFLKVARGSAAQLGLHSTVAKCEPTPLHSPCRRGRKLWGSWRKPQPARCESGAESSSVATGAQGEHPALPVDKEEGGPRPCSSSVLAACPLGSEYLSEEWGGTCGEAVTGQCGVWLNGPQKRPQVWTGDSAGAGVGLCGALPESR